MSITPETIDTMLAAGIPPEQVLKVVRDALAQQLASEEAKAEKRRAQTLARVHKHRETQRNARNALHPSFPPDGPPAPLHPLTPPLTPPSTPVPTLAGRQRKPLQASRNRRGLGRSSSPRACGW